MLEMQKHTQTFCLKKSFLSSTEVVKGQKLLIITLVKSRRAERVFQSRVLVYGKRRSV